MAVGVDGVSGILAGIVSATLEFICGVADNALCLLAEPGLVRADLVRNGLAGLVSLVLDLIAEAGHVLMEIFWRGL